MRGSVTLPLLLSPSSSGSRMIAEARAPMRMAVWDKPREEQGYDLAPEVYGQPLTTDVFWAKHPEILRK